MHEVFKDANEKYVAGVIAYADSDDGHLFREKEHEVKLTRSEVLNLFTKGLLVISYESEFFRPTSCKDNTTSAAVVVHNDTTNYTFNSDTDGE